MTGAHLSRRFVEETVMTVRLTAMHNEGSTIRPWTVSKAKYAKEKMLVRPTDSAAGFKGSAGRLIEFLSTGWTGRERGYVLSVAAVRKLEALFDAGYRARSGLPPWTKSALIAPDGTETTVREAMKELGRKAVTS